MRVLHPRPEMSGIARLRKRMKRAAERRTTSAEAFTVGDLSHQENSLNG